MAKVSSFGRRATATGVVLLAGATALTGCGSSKTATTTTAPRATYASSTVAVESTTTLADSGQVSLTTNTTAASSGDNSGAIGADESCHVYLGSTSAQKEQAAEALGAAHNDNSMPMMIRASIRTMCEIYPDRAIADIYHG